MTPRLRLGRALRSIRAAAGLTLAEVSASTGLAISTLSKVENGRMSLTYDKLLQLSAGLKVDFATLLGDGTEDMAADGAETPGPSERVTARRSVSRAGEGVRVATDNYDVRYLCTELSHRAMVPMVSAIRARTLAEFGEPYAHGGEELIHVLDGAIELWSEVYEPVRLEAGDSVYFDSTMRHAVLSVGVGDARILNVCFMPDAQDTRTLEEILAAQQRNESAESAPQPKAAGKPRRSAVTRRNRA